MLITEGGTSTVFPEYNLTPGITIETPDDLYVRGSVLKTMLGDKAQPGALRLRPEHAGGLLQPGAR